MLTGDRNVGMSQSSTRGVDSVLGAYLGAKLLPQGVKRLVTGDAVVTEPFSQSLKKSLAPIVGICCTGLRRYLRFDHEVSSSSRVEASKDFQQFRINFHVSDGIL